MIKKHIILAALLQAVLFTACEKGIDLVSAESTVYLPQSGLSTQTALLGSSVYELGVYQSGIPQHNGAVTVSLSVDAKDMTDFLSKNPGYEMLPATYYSIPATQVTIGKGSAQAPFRIELKEIDESFSAKKYVLPVRISSAGGAKVNAAKAIAYLNFQRYRNVYETKYKAYGIAKPTSGTGSAQKVDEVVTAVSAGANTIRVKGAATGMDLLLTVQGNQVQVAGAPGAEAFNVQPAAGKSSTYTGGFSDTYQCNIGTYQLYYTYKAGAVQMEAEVELKFWQ